MTHKVAEEKRPYELHSDCIGSADCVTIESGMGLPHRILTTRVTSTINDIMGIGAVPYLIAFMVLHGRVQGGQRRVTITVDFSVDIQPEWFQDRIAHECTSEEAVRIARALNIYRRTKSDVVEFYENQQRSR